MNRRLFLFGALGAAVPLPAVASVAGKPKLAATIHMLGHSYLGTAEREWFYQNSVSNGWLTADQARTAEGAIREIIKIRNQKGPPR